jgi:hypothetical protein
MKQALLLLIIVLISCKSQTRVITDTTFCTHKEEVAYRFNWGVMAWVFDSKSYETNF